MVRYLSNRIAVMYLGQIVESASAEDIFTSPRHPYTQALLSSIPNAPRMHALPRIHLTGEPPSPADPPKACRFHPRCPFRQARCETVAPALREVGKGHSVACHLAEEPT